MSSTKIKEVERTEPALDDIKMTLDGKSSGILTDVDGNNLEEILESRRAWEDYKGSPDKNLRRTSAGITLLGSGMVIGDFLLGWNTGAVGTFFGVAGGLLYVNEKISEYRFEQAKGPLEEIDHGLENCYILKPEYNLLAIRDEVAGSSGEIYGEVLDRFKTHSRAEELASEELRDEQPVEDWESEWEETLDSEKYAEGLQVIWMDEKTDIDGGNTATEWKIEVYRNENDGYEVVHESYGATTNQEMIQEVKKEGKNVMNNLREAKEIFNTPGPQLRIRKPS